MQIWPLQHGVVQNEYPNGSEGIPDIPILSFTVPGLSVMRER